MIVPYASLSADALSNIIEDWLSRQAQETLLDEDEKKRAIAKIESLLQSKELFLTWDECSQTINLLATDQLPD